ncbi:polyhomeotic-like protein 2 [Diaphorina citri]|uniref:Polyhomeotic-like protein 2 n=1 Tax=Diaphorina citri TaxID=121845 RepID=A0A1S3CZF3_DIACI|nr:polyhomeotic-like protein 2 [Diaphorina citri]
MTPPTPLPPPPPPPVSTNHGTLEPSHNVSEQTAPVPPPPPSSQPQQHSMPSLSEDVESNNTASSVSSNTNTKDKPITTQATLPKTTALVKPQILTHVIEGFVIQESDQPFPVNRGACFDLIREDIGTDDGAPLAKKLHTLNSLKIHFDTFVKLK